MIRAIQEFFFARIETEPKSGGDDHALHLATAALLFEVLRVDDEEHPEELAAVEKALQDVFGLGQEEIAQLAELARQEAEESVSLHQFTSLVNDYFSMQQRVRVVEMLWQVAYADGHLDRYEEALARKISDLLYVSHRDFIRAKHRVLDGMSKPLP